MECLQIILQNKTKFVSKVEIFLDRPRSRSNESHPQPIAVICLFNRQFLQFCKISKNHQISISNKMSSWRKCCVIIIIKLLSIIS